jgi:hypothetical protein
MPTSAAPAILIATVWPPTRRRLSSGSDRIMNTMHAVRAHQWAASNTRGELAWDATWTDNSNEGGRDPKPVIWRTRCAASWSSTTSQPCPGCRGLWTHPGLRWRRSRWLFTVHRSPPRQGVAVTATTSARDTEFVASLGARKVIDCAGSRFEDHVAGVHVEFDTMGGDPRTRSWALLRPGGVLVSIVAPADVGTARDHVARGVSFVVRPGRVRRAREGVPAW